VTSRGVLVAHPNTQYSYEAALALQERGALLRYVTGFYYRRASGPIAPSVRAMPRRLRAKLERELKRRHQVGLDERLVATSPVGELLSVVVGRRLPARWGFAITVWSQQRFARRVAALVRRIRPAVVVCYDNTYSEVVFEAAREVGAFCVLDQSIGHVTQLLREYAAAGITSDESSEMVARSAAEVHAADVILAPSTYVAETLRAVGVPIEKTIVIPFGADLERFQPPAERRDDGLVRALYVGRVSKRKGVQYIIEAFRSLRLPQLDVTVVGPNLSGLEMPIGERFHAHPGLPHHEIHSTFQQSDMFLQMSLHEGSTITIYEALAAGLPVITTPNAGSVVRDGIDGFIVPSRDVGALANRISRLCTEPQLRRRMSANARRRAEQFSWKAYRDRLGDLLRDLAEAAPDERMAVFAGHRARMADVLASAEEVTDRPGSTMAGNSAGNGNGGEE